MEVHSTWMPGLRFGDTEAKGISQTLVNMGYFQKYHKPKEDQQVIKLDAFTLGLVPKCLPLPRKPLNPARPLIIRRCF